MERRKDAFLAAAEYALAARDHVVRKGSGRSVTNFGHIELGPGVSNIVPARARLLQEMRELEPRILARLDRECQALARAVARRRKCRVEVETLSRTGRRALLPAGHARGGRGLRRARAPLPRRCRRRPATTPRTSPT